MAKRRGTQTGGFAEADGAAYVADSWLEIEGANLDLTPYEDLIQEGVSEAFRPQSDSISSAEALAAEIDRRAQEAEDDPSSLIPIEYLLPILNEIDRRVALRMADTRD